jgi:hypothetical protein
MQCYVLAMSGIGKRQLADGSCAYAGTIGKLRFSPLAAATHPCSASLGLVG